MVMHISDLYNSLEGRTNILLYWGGRTKNQIHLTPKICTLAQLPLSYLFEIFPEHVSLYLRSQWTLTFWQLGLKARIQLQITKTIVHFSLACFPVSCQLSLISHCCQWVWPPLFILLVWCDQITKPCPEQKKGKWWHLCCVAARLGHPLQLPCLAQKIDNSWNKTHGLCVHNSSTAQGFFYLIWFTISEVADGQVGKQWVFQLFFRKKEDCNSIPTVKIPIYCVDW